MCNFPLILSFPPDAIQPFSITTEMNSPSIATQWNRGSTRLQLKKKKKKTLKSATGLTLVYLFSPSLVCTFIWQRMADVYSWALVNKIPGATCFCSWWSGPARRNTNGKDRLNLANREIFKIRRVSEHSDSGGYLSHSRFHSISVPCTEHTRFPKPNSFKHTTHHSHTVNNRSQQQQRHGR